MILQLSGLQQQPGGEARHIWWPQQDSVVPDQEDKVGVGWRVDVDPRSQIQGG